MTDQPTREELLDLANRMDQFGDATPRRLHRAQLRRMPDGPVRGRGAPTRSPGGQVRFQLPAVLRIPRTFRMPPGGYRPKPSTNPVRSREIPPQPPAGPGGGSPATCPLVACRRAGARGASDD